MFYVGFLGFQLESELLDGAHDTDLRFILLKTALKSKFSARLVS